MKVYITKYALTQGILLKDAKLCDTSNTMINIIGDASWYIHKPHWHLRLVDAIGQANKMRQQAIRSCNKKLKKLEDMKF